MSIAMLLEDVAFSLKKIPTPIHFHCVLLRNILLAEKNWLFFLVPLKFMVTQIAITQKFRQGPPGMPQPTKTGVPKSTCCLSLKAGL